MKARLLASVGLLAGAWAGVPAHAFEFNDPFDSASMVVSGPGLSQDGRLHSDCPRVTEAAMSLLDVVNHALCNNPQTRLAWANAQAQAASVGVAQSAYLPTLGLNAAKSEPFGANPLPVNTQTNGALSLGFLIYDFGGRAATLENARQLLSSLAATQDAVLQSVFLSAVQAYYQWHAAEAAVTAAREAERASLESLHAAQSRYRIGTATPADRLLAQTALSQATLARIQAEGNAQSSLGVVANVMGLDAQEAPKLTSVPLSMPDGTFEEDLNALIAQAKQMRPDALAAQAQVNAARAAVDVARASGMPSLSANASNVYQNINASTVTRSYSVGLTLTVPIFSGFNTAYRVRNAQALVDAKAAQYEQVSKQVSLDVWKNYYALRTSIDAVRAASDLVASAQESEKAALGRYKAGVGAILDVLNAQSALASAWQQFIQTQYNWKVAAASLAQAMGQLGYEHITKAISQ